MSKPKPPKIVMVYGSFNDPKTKQNFFMIRFPDGRVPWAAKMAPALNRMIRAWYSVEDLKRDRAHRQRYGYGELHWNVEGQEDNAWDVSMCSRYEWNGTEFVEQPRGDGPKPEVVR